MSSQDMDRAGSGPGSGAGRGRQTQASACGSVCMEAGACSCGARHGAVQPDTGATTWAPAQCTLPVVEQPVRVAEFDALFASAVRGVQRAAPVRLRLVLDPAQETAARDLAAREGGCCSFFTFALARNSDGLLDWEITVPEAQVPVLDALAVRAAAALAEAAR